MKAAVAIALTVLSIACSDAPPEVVVCVDIEPATRARATSLSLVVTDQDSMVVYDRLVPVSSLGAIVGLPVRARGGDSSRLFTVTAELSDETGVFQRAVAEGRFRDELGAMRIVFEDACADVVCEGNAACRAGSCGGPFSNVAAVEDRSIAAACMPLSGPMDGGLPDAMDGGPDTDVGDASVPDTSPPDGAGCTDADHWSCPDPLIAVQAGEHHTCALRRSGRVLCWGENNDGQLGPRAAGTSTDGPEHVVGIEGATAISTGWDHTCVIIDGDVWCWGENESHQLGYANSLCSIGCEPTMVPVAGSFIGVAGAEAHSCALRGDGTVACWGDDYWGQLGNGGGCGGRTSAREVMIAGAVDVASGYYHSCVVAGGEVSCWGRNDDFQTASTQQMPCSGTTEFVEPAPTMMMGISSVDEVATGRVHTCARVGGDVYCWGSNSQGQLGVSLSTSESTTPMQAAGVADATQLAAGRDHNCALTSSGRVLCWGYGFYGQVGNGMAARTSAGFPVMTIDDATAVGVGDTHSCAITASRGVVCWGRNDFRQLGTASGDTAIPVEIDSPTPP